MRDISLGWIKQRLLKTVKLNGREEEYSDWKYNYSIINHKTETIDRFGYESLLSRIVCPPRELNLVEQIWFILSHGNFRRGSLELINPYVERFKLLIKDFIDNNDPLSLVLPTLPFKDQNPLTTHHSVDFVDLGEYLLVQQIKSLRGSISMVYPPGIRFIIVCDGLVYRTLFTEASKREIILYREKCRRIFKDLNVSGVKLVDMNDIIKKEPRFSFFRERIRHLIEGNKDENILKRVDSLQKGILLNISSHYSVSDYIRIISVSLSKIPTDLYRASREATISYASFLMTLQYLQVLENQFPGTLRLTVHPKEAFQLPYHLVNRHTTVFPYNGVPLVSKEKYDRTEDIGKATRIVRYYQLPPEVTAIYRKGDEEPFYYLI